MTPPYRYHLLPCGGPRCGEDFAEAAKVRLKELIPRRKELGVRISTTSCQGMCKRGPNLMVYPEGIAYHGLNLEDLERIVREHVEGGIPVEEFQERGGEDQPPEESSS